MKKQTLLPLLALLLAVAAYAFTTKENDRPVKTPPTSQAYFAFMGSVASEENQAENWQRVDNPGNLCQSGSNLLCTIQAPIADPDDEHPDFTGISNVRTSTLVSNRVYKP